MRNLLFGGGKEGRAETVDFRCNFRRYFRFRRMITVGEPLRAESIVTYLEKSQRETELMGYMSLTKGDRGENWY